MAKRKHPKTQKSRARTPQAEHAVARSHDADHGAGRDRNPGARSATGRDAVALWGFHPVRAALSNPDRHLISGLATTAATAALLKEAGDPAAKQALERQLAPLQRATNREIDSAVPEGAVHQGLYANVTPLPRVDLTDVTVQPGKTGPSGPEHPETGAAGPAPANGLLVFLDQVTDPHNVGAIMRSCAVFGAQALVTTDRNTPSEGGTLAKSAAGALDIVPWVRVGNLAQSLDRLKEDGWWVVGLAGEAEKSIAEAGLDYGQAKVVLILGAEGAGLRRLTKEKCDILVHIPMSYDNKKKCVNLIDSLNVSNAAAVALYEICRR